MTIRSEWIRSSRCDTGSCVEAAAWMKSPYSGADGCVEVASGCESGNCVVVEGDDAGEVLIRDSKLGEAGPVLRFTWAEWRAFVDGIAGIDTELHRLTRH